MRKLFVAIGLLCLFGMGVQAQSEKKEKIAKQSFIGLRFPDFTVDKWLTKEPKLKGKFTLVDFWCIMAYPVTHRTVPYLNHLAKKYKKQLQVVGLTYDEANLVKLMIDPDIQYYSGVVHEQVVYGLFGLTGCPTVYLVDPDGMVVWEGYVLKEGYGNKNTFNLTEEMLEHFFEDYQAKSRKGGNKEV